MKNNTPVLETLLERAEDYGKTTYELFKYNAIDKTTEVASEFASNLIVYVVFGVFIMLLSIGVALWIGELLGKFYFGFFIVSIAYLLMATVLYFSINRIKKGIGNTIVTHIFN